MSFLQIIQIIFGLPLALFIPGYLAARIFFKELDELEKVAIGFVLNISLDIVLGLFLGYNEYMKNLTGGITALNLWIYLGFITIILFMVWVSKNHDEYKRLFHRKIDVKAFVKKIGKKKEEHYEHRKDTVEEK